MNESINQLDPRAVRRQSERRAAAPDDAAYVAARCAQTLEERLGWLTLEPRTILDTSADGGRAAAGALRRFRGARLIRAGSASYGTERRRWWRRGRDVRLAPDAERIDLPDRSIDLAIANLALPWVPQPDAWLAELGRVLAPDAPLIIATPGPDTFRELRELWSRTGLDRQVPVFTDMHDIGDALVRAGFVEPVLDVDRVTVEFATAGALWRDLRAAGAGNVLAGRPQGLAGRQRFADAARELDPHGRGVAVTVELVFAHAFAGDLRRSQRPGEAVVDVSSIGRRRP